MRLHIQSAVNRFTGSLFLFRQISIAAACCALLMPGIAKAQSSIFQHAIPVQQSQSAGVGGFASNTFKTQFDSEVQKHFDQHKIPGMVVLMARDGMVTYKKTLGFADVANQVPVTEHHVFRLASISKWVAGLMALKAEQQGQINLGEKADSLLGYLPEHHTSRVIDFLTCRAGIRHYGEPTSPISPAGWDSTVYESAADALPNMWHDPHGGTVGMMHYSTHSYTFLGACVEQATGRTVPQLVRELLANPHNLNTLRTEDLNFANANRVKLYERVDVDNPGAGNRATSRDNLTWKFLGGGLESSGLDLLRLGMKVCDKQVISNNNLNRMLTRLDSNTGYNLGCNTGVENGNRILAKNGGQTGASTYIWLAPDKRMVMVVLTNIRQGKASSLGKKLRQIALGATNTGDTRPDLVVNSFSKTGTPYYEDGQLKIPFQMQVENKGKGGTPNSFTNGIRLGSNYRWTRFMQPLPPSGKKTVTGVIRINDPSKLQKGRTLTFVANADAAIAAADTSIASYARVQESIESNNGRILRVKIPGGIGGLQVAQPNRDTGVNQGGSPTRTNPPSQGTRTNPTPGRRTNPGAATRTNPGAATRTNPGAPTRANPSVARRTSSLPKTKTAPAPSSKAKTSSSAKRTNPGGSSAKKKAKPRRIDKSQGESPSPKKAAKKKRKKKNSSKK